MKTVAYWWNKFSTAILHHLPEDSIQKKEMKRAFYAGFLAAMCASADVARIFQPAEAVSKLNEMKEELNDFSTDIKEGRA